MNKEVLENIMALATEDYQNRKGNYPRSNVPDTIDVTDLGNTIEICADFKNTDEDTAVKWLEKKLKKLGIKTPEIYAGQTGDYLDDWVQAWTELKK